MSERFEDDSLDVITDIKKIGSLDDLPTAEIFMTLRDHGEYSVDPYVFPDFENFWINAHEGSEVIVSKGGFGVGRLSLVNRY